MMNQSSIKNRAEIKGQLEDAGPFAFSKSSVLGLSLGVLVDNGKPVAALLLEEAA